MTWLLCYICFLATGESSTGWFAYLKDAMKKFFLILFIYFWLCWIFAAAQAFFLVVVIWGYSLVVHRLFLLQYPGSRVHGGFSSCS